MVDLVLVRTRNNPSLHVKKNSDSGKYSGRRFAPYGIMSIAQHCRDRGHEVRLFDLFAPRFDDRSIEEIGREILELQPRMVGISSMTSQSVEAKRLGDHLMARSDTTVVHGGVHPGTDPFGMLEHGHYVVQGDGEHAMHGMLSSDAYHPAAARETEAASRIVQGELLSAAEMDAIAFPRKEQFDETAFDPGMGHDFPIITARGCPFRCIFCKDGFGLRTSAVRFQSVDWVVDFLEYIYKTYGTPKIGIIDDIFLHSVERMEEMAIAFEKRKLKLQISCHLHANTVKPNVARLMRRLGVEWVYVGVESGSDAVLKKIQKGTTVARVEESLAQLKRYGFYVVGMYMIGNIGETPQSVRDTLRLALRLPTDRAWFSFAAPYPGTPFFEVASEHGEILEPDFGKWNQASLVFRPTDLSKAQMYRYMALAQGVRAYKKFRHTFVGRWEVPLRRRMKAHEIVQPA